MKTALKKRISIKADFDCLGGVENVTVTKYEIYNESGTDSDKEVIFKGDITGLSANDCEDEIKAALIDRFAIEDYETIVSIS